MFVLLPVLVLVAAELSTAARLSDPRIRFGHHKIDKTGGEQVTYGIDVGDIDRDGRPDVVVGGDRHLIWYHNADWALGEIAAGSYGVGARVAVRDLDGDGRPDVVTGSGNQTWWFANGPGGWVRHLLSPDAYCHDLAFGDLDGDLRADAVCVDQLRGRVVWLGAPADPTGTWSPHVIDGNESAMGATVADIDRDGRRDAVVGRAWYRNNGGGSWTRVPYTDVYNPDYPGFDDFAQVSVLDLDGNGRLDIFATLYAETPAAVVYAFLAPPDPLNDPWTAVPVDTEPHFCVHSQVAASFDGTGRPQIMVADSNYGGWDFGKAPRPRLYVYRLVGDAADPAAWERHKVGRRGTHEARSVDLDGDGRLDLVGHLENTDHIGGGVWGAVSQWTNRTQPTVSP